jgi:hypothetical protein
VDYIKTLKGTLMGLEELKLEHIRAQLLGVGIWVAFGLLLPSYLRSLNFI